MEAEFRRFSSDRQRRRLNGLILVAIGALLAFADSLIFPIILGAMYADTLTGQLELIGLVPAIAVAGFLVPQAIVSALIVHRPQRSFAVLFTVFRTAALVFITWDSLDAPASPDDRLRNFLAGLLVFAIASGAAASPSITLIGRAVPIYRRRSTIRNRRFAATIAGIVAGVVAWSVLGAAGPAYPRNFAYLFGAAALCSGVSVFLYTQVKEPTRVTAIPEGQAGANVLSPLGDSGFRHLLVFRFALALAAIADPFFVIWAIKEFELPLRYAGLYIIALAAAALSTMVLWKRLRDRGGSRVLLQCASFARLAPPLLALILLYVRDAQFYQDRYTGYQPLQIASVGIFVAIGISIAAHTRANFNYIHEISPLNRRRSYRDLMNFAMAIAAFGPVAGGLIAERYGFDRLFLVAGGFALSAIFLSGLLSTARVSPVTPSLAPERYRV